MLITSNDFQELGRALQAAKKDPANRCMKLRCCPDGCEDNGDGTYSMWQPVSGVPRRQRGEATEFKPDGDGGTLKKCVIKLGEHGIAFLAIDPATLKVACTECKKGGK